MYKYINHTDTCKFIHHSNRHINKDTSKLHLALYSYLKGSHIVWILRVKESKDEWWLCKVGQSILHYG